eukprot:GHVN01103969.1.p1 GENE.GHVN01103969.1~~GHVN01103969.1.p1  ORF type:complete len:193 (-),score=30.65 GHVN01103969.1:163-741(-)
MVEEKAEELARLAVSLAPRLRPQLNPLTWSASSSQSSLELDWLSKRWPHVKESDFFDEIGYCSTCGVGLDGTTSAIRLQWNISFSDRRADLEKALVVCEKCDCIWNLPTLMSITTNALVAPSPSNRDYFNSLSDHFMTINGVANVAVLQQVVSLVYAARRTAMQCDWSIHSDYKTVASLVKSVECQMCDGSA